MSTAQRIPVFPPAKSQRIRDLSTGLSAVPSGFWLAIATALVKPSALILFATVVAWSMVPQKTIPLRLPVSSFQASLVRSMTLSSQLVIKSVRFIALAVNLSPSTSFSLSQSTLSV